MLSLEEQYEVAASALGLTCGVAEANAPVERATSKEGIMVREVVVCVRSVRSSTCFRMLIYVCERARETKLLHDPRTLDGLRPDGKSVFL